MIGGITEPTWMLAARREIGVKEKPGHQDHPRIVEYLQHVRLIPALQHDETPWCSAFVCFVMEQTDITSTHSAAARSWLTWGIELKEPLPGAIAVLTREGHPGSGHVGFFVSQTKDHVLLLGGNQNNQVCVRPYEKSRVLSYRWPQV